ncbi:MAG: ABC transporter ATP-binding protein [Acidimicrobiales bacterium]
MTETGAPVLIDDAVEAPSEVLLRVRDLRTEIRSENGLVKAVDGVSFEVRRGETLAIVGESGCGKTMTALSILDLLPRRVARIAGGSVLFCGRELVGLPAREMRRIRGPEIAMIFQDALTGLNPVHRVGDQIAEMIRAHERVSARQAGDRAVELLRTVGIPSPERRARNYVHQFSGGMRQRAMIALAIALEPKLLIADEPTTALDVTVQAQVLEVLQEVQERIGSSIILITHDLGVVAGVADRVLVMYAGRQIEEQPVTGLYGRPRHPYTWGLLRAMPRIDRHLSSRLVSIAGAPPSLIEPPDGCRFAPRCPHVIEECRQEYPTWREIGEDRYVACHRADEIGWVQTLNGEESDDA